jgi:hypothetical protein
MEQLITCSVNKVEFQVKNQLSFSTHLKYLGKIYHTKVYSGRKKSVRHLKNTFHGTNQAKPTVIKSSGKNLNIDSNGHESLIV